MQDGMFYRIGDYAYARNARQALGFYLFHLLLGCIGFMLAAVVYKLLIGLPEGDAAMRVLSKPATVLSMLYVGYLSYRLLEAKGLLSRPKYLAYALLTLVVSMGGMLLGLVGVACFSILRPVSASAEQGEMAISEEE